MIIAELCQSTGAWAQAIRSMTPAEWFQGTGAWAQAIGTIVALGIAIWIPKKQRDEQIKGQQVADGRRARALAITLRPALEAWQEPYTNVESVLRAGDGRNDREIILKWAAEGPLFSAPEILLKRVDDLYLLGPACDLLFNAMRKAHEAQSLAGAVYAQASNDNDYVTEDKIVSSIWKSAVSVQEDIAAALDTIVEMI